MIVLFDENVGKYVPRALRSVGFSSVFWIGGPGGIRHGTPDVRWLTVAGQRGWLVFSCNKEMLNVDEERQTIEREKVGIVFLTTGQEKLPELLHLLLHKWSWLETIDQTERPFVYTLSISGRTRQVPIAPLRIPRRRR